jgi:GDP-4-dehydro-6-deoxy-D-mannose reductase
MASKAAADLALGAMTESGLRCIRFRPFNHTGLGQSENFALPNFALQIARIKAGLQEARMRVGNLDVMRDFLDVRDVASAYIQAALRSEQINPGEIFNVASGIPRRIRDVLDEMLRMSKVDVVVETDREKVRSTEIVRFVGDASKAQRLLDWTPKYSFEQTLREILEDADRAVRDGLKATT